MTFLLFCRWDCDFETPSGVDIAWQYRNHIGALVSRRTVQLLNRAPIPAAPPTYGRSSNMIRKWQITRLCPDMKLSSIVSPFMMIIRNRR